MTKKDRTGLQSKVSHIFAGVPIPKKSQPAGSQDAAASKPQENDVIQMSSEAEDTIEWKTEPQADIDISAAPEPVKEITFGQQHSTAGISHEVPKPKEIAAEDSLHSIETIPDDEKTGQPLRAYKPDVGQNLALPAVPVLSAEPDSSDDIRKDKTVVEQTAHTSTRGPVTVIEKKSASVVSYKAAAKRKTGKSKANAGQKRQKEMLVLFVGFSILLVLILFNPFRISSKAPVSSPVKELGNDSSVLKISGTPVTIKWDVPDYPTDIKDPMTEGTSLAKSVDKLQISVTAITVSLDRSNATIKTNLDNGSQLVHEGEKIEGTGITVTKIVAEYVEFEENGETWRLSQGEQLERELKNREN
jgi:hypothetical protein